MRLGKNRLGHVLSYPEGWVGRWILAPLWNRRNRALNLAALRALKCQPDSRVLEIGCGGGDLLSRILSAHTDGIICGVDRAMSMLHATRRKQMQRGASNRLIVLQALAERLPYPAGCFDRVCSVNSLFYWEDPAQGLAEMVRVLGPAGRLVLVFTQREDLDQKSFASDLFCPDPAHMVHLLSGLGLQDVRVKSGRDRHRRFYCLSGEIKQHSVSG